MKPSGVVEFRIYNLLHAYLAIALFLFCLTWQLVLDKYEAFDDCL